MEVDAAIEMDTGCIEIELDSKPITNRQQK